MSSNNGNKELLNDIELEMKSNIDTNSEIISIDEIPKKEIIDDNEKADSYKELKLMLNENKNGTNDNNAKKENISEKNNNNNSTKDDKSYKENQNEIFGDLTSIIKDKIRARNIKENDKKKKIRLLSSSSMDQKNKKPIPNLNVPSTTKSKKTQIIYNSKNIKIKSNSSVPKNNNNIKNNKKTKINPELFINKKNENNTTRKEEKKKINFDDVLKRFDEEKKTAQKRFDNKKKQLIDKENKECTGKPHLLKKNGKKNEKMSKDFLIRQKEFNDNVNLKKKKMIEENNKKKENEYKKMISESMLVKKMKKHKKNKSDDEWVERLYKEDLKNRKMRKDFMQNVFLPSFKPNIPKKKINRSIDKNKDVLEEYNEKQDPQLLINYLNKNNQILEGSEDLLRQRALNKFIIKNKKKSHSVDINENNNDDEENESDEDNENDANDDDNVENNNDNNDHNVNNNDE